MTKISQNPMTAADFDQIAIAHLIETNCNIDWDQVALMALTVNAMKHEEAMARIEGKLDDLLDRVAVVVNQASRTRHILLKAIAANPTSANKQSRKSRSARKNAARSQRAGQRA